MQQIRECFTWHRTRKHIAPDHYIVYFCLANLLEHGLQGGEVTVNIVDCSDSHERDTFQLARCDSSRAGCQNHQKVLRSREAGLDPLFSDLTILSNDG